MEHEDIPELHMNVAGLFKSNPASLKTIINDIIKLDDLFLQPVQSD